eukprot:3384017-Lingulodinium_polyedra.AAC.1
MPSKRPEQSSPRLRRRCPSAAPGHGRLASSGLTARSPATSATAIPGDQHGDRLSRLSTPL